VPRAKTGVKPKAPTRLSSLGAVDLHFHGAFGVDLMTAEEPELDALSRDLWLEAGVAAFCPTTLSAAPDDLLEAVTRLGRWIRRGKHPGSVPLGIHLEGPFIHAESCGAHPLGAIRPLDFEELERLWTASQKTLKILTLAPELILEEDQKRLVSWAKPKGIKLSLGHSRATDVQAKRAFELGFSGVTHAWNALPFHHRAPGPLGGALGRPGVYVEIIPDLVHVHPTTIRWTRTLHPNVCFVSDCVPAAGTPAGSWHRFGSLKVHFSEGAARLENGHLAGGGRTLTDVFGRWIEHESAETGKPVEKLWKEALPYITSNPLKALGVSAAKVSRVRIYWSKQDSRWRPQTHAAGARS
jgi:N-acetylglucosamine-6-phosphate deacetylase